MAVTAALATPWFAAAAPPPAPLDPPQAGPAKESSRGGWQGMMAMPRAKNAWGPALPTGAGVVALHVEGRPDAYAPDLDNPALLGVNFELHDGPSPPNPHATTTARTIYGPRGAAPGIRTVHWMTVARWMTRGYLRTGTADPPDQLSPPPRIMTHSWIAGGQTPNNAAVLRRLDFVIDRDDVLCFVGVNNNRNTAVPELLGSAHNALAIGRADGQHSTGYTTFEDAGRCKPDMVAPGPTTSEATPMAAAIGARLIEFAGRNDHNGDERAETLKAVLLAGAWQPEKWAPEPGKPLDAVYGAGVVDLDRSLRILDAGPTPPGETAARYGWWFGALDPSAPLATWRFFNPEPAGEARMTLTWHRRIGGPGLIGAATANFDLRLTRTHDAQGRPLDTPEPVATSASEVDNVEHLSVDGLPAGGYRVLVQRQADRNPVPWDYALAWRIEGASPPENAPPPNIAEDRAPAPASAPSE